MLKSQLQNNYVVKAIEIDSRDFLFYSDKDMISTTSEDLGKELFLFFSSGQKPDELLITDRNSLDKWINKL